MTAAVAAGQDYGLGVSPGAKADPRLDRQDFQQIVLSCNKDGMDLLRSGQYKQAFEQLKYAEAILLARQGEEEPTNLMAVMCNNLGCYYKKVGKLHAALSYLRKALKIEVSLQTDDVTVAGTHLNICAILSKLDKHDKAVQHALCALELINNRVASTGDSVTQDEYSVLAIAYHNVAVERDYMHQWDQAAAAYQQGHLIARKCLGEEHPLTVTLGKNRDAALQKSHKYSRERQDSAAPPTPTATATAASSSTPALPEIAPVGAQRGRDEAGEPMPLPRNNVHQEASEWVQSEEPSSWRPAPTPGQPAQAAVGAGQYQRLAATPMLSPRTMQASSGLVAYPPMPPPPPTDPPQTLDARPNWAQPSHQPEAPPATSGSLAAAGGASAAVPLARPPSPPPLVIMGKEKRHRSKDRSVSISSTKTREDRAAPLETPLSVAPPPGRNPRPPRPRRARDEPVVAGGTAGRRPAQSQLLRKTAAEKIQRFWREYRRRKMDAKTRTAQEHAAATMIQARWRAFHVRRQKHNKACIIIQKWVRGFLVRLEGRKQKAARTVQRHATGMIVRRRMRAANHAATKIQRAYRAVLAKRHAKEMLRVRLRAAALLQRGLRRWKVRAKLWGQQREKELEEAKERAATRVQSVFRGNLGRAKATDRRERWIQILKENRAATHIQAAYRRHLAKKKVDVMRAERLAKMNAAATIIRKYWLCHIHRRHFLQLRRYFRNNVAAVVTIQRYVRGYVVRLRLWRNAIRAEEELWAAVEIQRCWRGYRGRLRWELEYEAVHSREEAARRLQRFIRGWLARTRVHRLRKRNARAEFEKARRRFKAAQRIQAVVRGHQARKRIASERLHKYLAAVAIQRVFRGHVVRRQRWEQRLYNDTVRIQALARGYLVRNRRFRLLAQVLIIQRHYRHWLEAVPHAERTRRVREWQERRQKAAQKAMEAARAAEVA